MKDFEGAELQMERQYNQSLHLVKILRSVVYSLKVLDKRLLANMKILLRLECDLEPIALCSYSGTCTTSSMSEIRI